MIVGHGIIPCALETWLVAMAPLAGVLTLWGRNAWTRLLGKMRGG